MVNGTQREPSEWSRYPGLFIRGIGKMTTPLLLGVLFSVLLFFVFSSIEDESNGQK